MKSFVKIKPPSVYLIPLKKAVLDSKEGISMFFHHDGECSLFKKAYPLEKQANEMHRVFPLDLPLVSDVLFKLLELRHRVTVVCLVRKLRKEDASLAAQRIANLIAVFDQRSE